MTSTVSLSLASVLWFWLSFCRPDFENPVLDPFSFRGPPQEPPEAVCISVGGFVLM